jgi:G3E family GTPase
MTAPDLYLLTGFLRSGKTPLLSDYVRQDQAANTAEIVNEVGEPGRGMR